MHPAANFSPSTPPPSSSSIPCNKDKGINQAEIADTRHVGIEEGGDFGANDEWIAQDTATQYTHYNGSPTGTLDLYRRILSHSLAIAMQCTMDGGVCKTKPPLLLRMNGQLVV